MVKLFENTEVFALKINREVDQKHFTRLLEFLNPELQEKAKAFKYADRRQTALFSNLLVRWLFQKFGLIQTVQLVYFYGEHGKPVILTAQDIKFNVSHSGHWIVCAISPDEVGIDIEERKTRNIDMIDNVLSDEEKRSLKATNSLFRTSLFYNIWTVKESYLKALGGGLYEPIELSKLVTSFSGGQPELSLEQEKIPSWKFHEFKIDPNYSMTVCHRSKNIKQEVTFVKIDDIIRDTLSSKY